MGLKRVTFVTAFPDFLECFLVHSIIGRAITEKVLEARVVNLRDFAVNRYGQVDDYAFGSGGMLLMAEPLAKALESLGDGGATVLYPSPQGVVLSQELVESLAAREHLVIVCGHYEGVDERFVEKHVDLEVSLGDFVLTGGELPAMVLLDAVARLVPGVVGKLAAVEDDSFYKGMLDHPHFTRPADWRGAKVPEALLSGDEAAIGEWRRREAVARTVARRPDLLATANIRPYLSRRPYLAISGETFADAGCPAQVERLAALYGFERVLVVEQDAGRLQELSSILGERALEDRTAPKLFKALGTAFGWVRKREKEHPFVVGLETVPIPESVHWVEAKRRILQSGKPLVLGLSKDLGDKAEITLSPLRGGLASEGTVDTVPLLAVFMDRFFGCR